MVSIDHTARFCPPVRKEPKSKSTSTVSASLCEEQERRRVFESRQAGAALAIAVMQGMLKHHRVSKPTHSGGKRKGLLLLNPVQCVGLETAIDLLHHYADTLTPASGG